jgi:hypothetical protein
MLNVLVLSLALQSAPAASPATAPTQSEALVVWSAGLDAIAPDARDRGALEGLRQLLPWGVQKAAEKDEHGAKGLALIGDWLQRPLCVRANLGSDGKPSASITIACASLEAARADLQTLRTLCDEDSPLELRAAGDDLDTLWASTPEGPVAFTVRPAGSGAVISIGLLRGPDPSLAVPELPVGGVDQPALVVRWDGRNLVQGLRALEPGTESTAQMLAVLEGLDLVGPRSPRRTWALMNSEQSARTVCVAEGWANSFAASRGSSPLTRADLKLLPADSSWAWMGNVNLAGFVDLALSIDREKVSEGLAGFKQFTGVDLQNDLLGKLGPVAGAYVSRSMGGSAMGGLVLFARSRDAAGVSGAFGRLLDLAKASAGPNAPFKLESWKHGSVACTSLSFPGMPVPVEPSIATNGDLVFLALGRSPLRQALDQVDTSSSLLDHAELAGLSDAELEGLVGFSFLDTPACVQRGYGMVNMILTSASQMVRSQGGPELTAFVPTGAKLSEGMRPAIGFTYLIGADRVSTAVHDRSWVARGTAVLGSPIGEVSPFNPMVAAIAIPKLMSARLSANEAAAIATLRSLSSAQAQFIVAGVADEDEDGAGEYGFFGELSGTRPIRGIEPDLLCEPAVLSPAFGELVPDGRGGAVVKRSGYYFQVWLPDARGGALSDREDPAEAKRLSMDVDSCEMRFCVYAWPIQSGNTGMRAFYIDQEGDMLVNDNLGEGYSGLPADGGRAPRFDAAFEKAGRFLDESQATDGGRPAADGNYWKLLQ